jgi:hypothetical protein
LRDVQLAANTIVHAHGHGTLRIWTEQERLVCESPTLATSAAR